MSETPRFRMNANHKIDPINRCFQGSFSSFPSYLYLVRRAFALRVILCPLLTIGGRKICCAHEWESDEV